MAHNCILLSAFYCFSVKAQRWLWFAESKLTVYDYAFYVLLILFPPCPFLLNKHTCIRDSLFKNRALTSWSYFQLGCTILARYLLSGCDFALNFSCNLGSLVFDQGLKYARYSSTSLWSTEGECFVCWYAHFIQIEKELECTG